MPGPTPKHASARARRNRTSTAATLRADQAITAPELPGDGWHPMTLAWWRDIWSSPMAPEYDESDRHGLYMLAALVDDFWHADSADQRRERAGEVRLQSQRFGLSPLDRRRLQWEIDPTDDGRKRGQQRRRQPTTKRKSSADPRSVLHAV